MPTPIVSLMTSGADEQMNSRENTMYDNSATLPIMNHESDEGYSSGSASIGSGRLNKVQIKNTTVSGRDDQQMNTDNSQPMDTVMRTNSQPQSTSEVT